MFILSSSRCSIYLILSPTRWERARERKWTVRTQHLQMRLNKYIIVIKCVFSSCKTEVNTRLGPGRRELLTPGRSSTCSRRLSRTTWPRTGRWTTRTATTGCPEVPRGARGPHVVVVDPVVVEEAWKPGWWNAWYKKTWSSMMRNHLQIIIITNSEILKSLLNNPACQYNFFFNIDVGSRNLHFFLEKILTKFHIFDILNHCFWDSNLLFARWSFILMTSPPPLNV